MGGYAWVTLATNDSYSLGALVLAHSLKQVGTLQSLVVLVTPGVTAPMRAKLSTVFDIIEEVNILDSKDETNLRLLKRPELGVTFTKLHCWRLTQFEKCVFLDADTLVLQNCDELFEREELSAAPDIGWPDCFNSGVFVYRPSNETYEKLVQFALDKGSFDGGDQGLLNLYFSDWAHKDISKHLPFIYNMSSTATYSYLPAFKQFGSEAKIIHFIAGSKPWLQYFNTETQQVQPSGDLQHLQQILQHWWNIFCSLIHPVLTPDMARSSSNATQTNYPTENPPSCIAVDTKDYFDPWDDYVHEIPTIPNIPNIDQQVPLEIEPIKSHNTNACSFPADRIEPPHHTIPTISHCDQSTFPQISCQNQPISDMIIISNQQPDTVQQISDYSNNSNVQTHSSETVSNSCVVNHGNQSVDHAQHSFEHSNTSNYTENNIGNNIHIEQVVEPSPQETMIHSENPLVVFESTKHNEPLSAALPTQSKTAPTISKEDDNQSGLAGAFAQLTLGVPRTAEQNALDDHLRRQGWEVGNIDYLGRDSFDNIWSKICETLSAAPSAPPPAKEPTPPKSEVAQTTPSTEIPTEAKAEVPKSVEEKPSETQLQETPQPTQTPISKVDTISPNETISSELTTILPTPTAVGDTKDPSTCEKTNETDTPKSDQTLTSLEDSTPEQSATSSEVSVSICQKPSVPVDVCPISSDAPACEKPGAPQEVSAIPASEKSDASPIIEQSQVCEIPDGHKQTPTASEEASVCTKPDDIGKISAAPEQPSVCVKPDCKEKSTAPEKVSVCAKADTPKDSCTAPDQPQVCQKPSDVITSAASSQVPICEKPGAPSGTPQVPIAQTSQVPTAETPQVPTTETPQVPTAEPPQAPTAETPQVPTAETPQVPIAETPQAPTAETPQVLPTAQTKQIEKSVPTPEVSPNAPGSEKTAIVSQTSSQPEQVLSALQITSEVTPIETTPAELAKVPEKLPEQKVEIPLEVSQSKQQESKEQPAKDTEVKPTVQPSKSSTESTQKPEDKSKLVAKKGEKPKESDVKPSESGTTSSTPTPPPRKGSGGSKKPKSKK